MKTVYTIGKINISVVIIIIVDYIFNFIVIVIYCCVASLQTLFGIIKSYIGIIFCSIENVVIHCICSIFIFAYLAYNNLIGRFLLCFLFRRSCGNCNWWWNISRIKIDIVSVGARYVTSSRTGAQHYCQYS